jgi:hypothetical protein
MSFKHTAESDQRIRDGYARSEPIREIGDALGLTRNAVIGRARRLGLTGTYDLVVAHQRIGDAHRGTKRAYVPRPGVRDWWANRPVEDKAAHFAKMWAGRDVAAAIRKRGEA